MRDALVALLALILLFGMLLPATVSRPEDQSVTVTFVQAAAPADAAGTDPSR